MSGDGRQILSFSMQWVTPDADGHADGHDDVCYLAPSDDSGLVAKARISWSLSGSGADSGNDWRAGDVTLVIPGHLFRTREGVPVGRVMLPYPESDRPGGDFDWVYDEDDDVYVVTSARALGAATTGYMEVIYTGVRPHVVADSALSKGIWAQIEAVTPDGTTLGAYATTSSAPAGSGGMLYARVDTREQVEVASKVSNDEVRLVGPESIPEDLRVPGCEAYALVEWYWYGMVFGNTVSDVRIDDEANVSRAGTSVGAMDGFVVSPRSMSPSSVSGGVTKSGQGIHENWYPLANDHGNAPTYVGGTTIVMAYPVLVNGTYRLGPDVMWTFVNNVTYTCREVDAAVPASENGVADDARLTTSKTSQATRRGRLPCFRI
jgi:hypothetical protein